MNLKHFILTFCLLYTSYSFAQGSYIPLGSYSMHVLDRMEIKQGRLANPQEYNTSTKAYLRGSIAHYADSFNTDSTPLSKQDLFNLQYLQNDNFEYSLSSATQTKKTLLGSGLYKHKAAFYDVEVPDFKLVINPITYFKGEHDQSQQTIDYINTRGIEIRGQIGQKLSFYTLLGDEIQKLNSWNQAYYDKDSVIPGQSAVASGGDFRTFNYWLASGYISFQPHKYIDIQFGQSRNFLGNGYRSFMMSDFSRDNLFLRVNTRIWKINYTNIWGEMLDYVYGGYQPPRRHYYATTYANVNITKKLSIGLFQTISFQRDSGYADGGYDPQYLNPIIFYKPVENGLNSPDKTILGMDVKYNFARHFSAYGQFVFSEFKIDQIIHRTGWYGNKQAIQVGLKYIDAFGINNLDLQYEYNWARPYMYTSYTPRNAYVNYNQNMAHPIGANFKENIAIVRYQPSNKLFITAKFITNLCGNDTNGSNWGKDIRKNYYTYEKEYGNTVAQGVTTRLYIGELTFTYMIWHNVFIDAACVYRKTKSIMGIFDTQTFNPSIALRWNINYRGCDF